MTFRAVTDGGYRLDAMSASPDSPSPPPAEAADGSVARPRVQSAARTVAILLAVAQSETGLTAKEISTQVGIGRQTAYHLLHTLSETGMLTRSDRNHYLLGLRVGTLAKGFERQLSPPEHLTPLVRALAQVTGETSYAAGWKDNEIANLAVVRGTNPVQAAEVPQGYVGSAHARASGKLLLAFADRGFRDAYLDEHPLVPVGPRTLTDRKTFDDELLAVHEQGYALDDEEFAPGLACLAVPLDAGHSPFVLAVSAPRERLLERREHYLAEMRKLAHSI